MGNAKVVIIHSKVYKNPCSFGELLRKHEMGRRQHNSKSAGVFLLPD